jgi:hypothetical protein
MSGGMFCAFKAVIKQSSLQTWQHASPFAMRSLSTLLLEHILISAELGMSWNVALLGWLSTQLLACKLSDGRRKIIKINVHSHAKQYWPSPSCHVLLDQDQEVFELIREQTPTGAAAHSLPVPSCMATPKMSGLRNFRPVFTTAT